MKQNTIITSPSLYDTLKLFGREIFASLNCVKIGEVVSFDPAKKTAAVRISFKKVLPDNTTRSYPLLLDCPVFTLQGGGASVQMPIVPGDQCLVLFADRNIDAWFKNGTEGAPFDDRCHDLSDGVALVGVNAMNSSLDNYVANEARMLYSGAVISLKGGKVVIKNLATDLLTIINAFFVVLEGLQVNGPIPLTAASIAALETIKAQFALLLGAP